MKKLFSEYCLNNKYHQNDAQIKALELLILFSKGKFSNNNWLKFFEEKNLIKIDIIADNTLIIPEYIINLQNKSKKTIEIIEHFEKLKNLEDQKKEAKTYQISNNKKPLKKKPFFKKKFYKNPAA